MLKYVMVGLVAAVLTNCCAAAMGGDAGTKDEAVAMVKKAIECIKADGNDKAFAEISKPKGKFSDRDLYVVVYETPSAWPTAPTPR